MPEQTLEKYFGFKSFRKGQKDVVSRLLDGESAAAIFPTGAGKSLCYQLPAILMPGLTIVVSPLLSLMKDQIDFLKSRGIQAERLDSTLTSSEYASILERAKGNDLKILMISVERFRNERFRNHLQKMKISLLVIDEAHCISEWGHNFRPDYLKLPLYRKEFGIDQVLLLTATATEKVVEDMCGKFEIQKNNVICTGFYRNNLFLQVSPVNEASKKEYLLKRLLKVPDAPTIIYVTLQKTAESIAEFLTLNGIKTSPYHAGMTNDDRERIQNEFISGSATCIAATIAFGMGIDKKDIRRIIHFDLPKSLENYSQEIGRAGRDGQLSFCEVIANRDNISVLENFIYGDTPLKTSIFSLADIIKEHPDQLLEVKPFSLSSFLDMRPLPFKTLMVYLELEGIVRPLYTRFDEYAFKYLIPAEDIIRQFNAERRDFVSEIFKNCHMKKIWAQVDIQAIMSDYPNTDRQRIVTALDYFVEKGWIELQTRQSVDIYEIVSRNFDPEALSLKLHGLFVSKENTEIGRIHNMVDFFEKDSCISRELAGYFGETIPVEKCGHCSFCRTGKTSIERTESLEPLEKMNRTELYGAFAEKAGDGFTVFNAAKFLCSISTPYMTKIGAKKLGNFGKLEKYPFKEVMDWVAAGENASRKSE